MWLRASARGFLVFAPVVRRGVLFPLGFPCRFYPAPLESVVNAVFQRTDFICAFSRVDVPEVAIAAIIFHISFPPLWLFRSVVGVAGVVVFVVVVVGVDVAVKVRVVVVSVVYGAVSSTGAAIDTVAGLLVV